MKHVKPLEHQNRDTVVMEIAIPDFLQCYLPSWLVAQAEPQWSGQWGTQHTSLSEMMLHSCDRSSASHEARNYYLYL